MESKSIKDTGHPKEATTMNHRSYYVAHTHSSDGPPNKRRRREELEFAAATVADALADAGRPSSLTSVTAGRRRERALPPGSVDLALARVVTSREFDEELESEAAEDASDDEEEVGASDGAVETVERQPVTATQHRDSTSQNEEEEQQQGEDTTKSNINSNSNSNNECEVSSMYMLSGLIQSTRHYYGFAPTYEGDLQSFSTKLHSRRYASEKQSEENSEGHSSWTPSSSCGDLVDEDYINIVEGKRRKELDNDNRSDEQSGSDMGDSFSCTSSDSPLPNDDSNKWWGCDGSERRESLSSIEGPLLIVG